MKQFIYLVCVLCQLVEMEWQLAHTFAMEIQNPSGWVAEDHSRSRRNMSNVSRHLQVDMLLRTAMFADVLTRVGYKCMNMDPHEHNIPQK